MLGRERRRAGAVVAEADVVEAHLPVGNSDTEAPPAQHRIKAGDGADFGLDGLAHRIGRHQKWQDHESADPDGCQGHNSKSKAFDANGRGHDASFSIRRR